MSEQAALGGALGGGCGKGVFALSLLSQAAPAHAPAHAPPASELLLHCHPCRLLYKAAAAFEATGMSSGSYQKFMGFCFENHGST